MDLDPCPHCVHLTAQASRSQRLATHCVWGGKRQYYYRAGRWVFLVVAQGTHLDGVASLVVARTIWANTAKQAQRATYLLGKLRLPQDEHEQVIKGHPLSLGDVEDGDKAHLVLVSSSLGADGIHSLRTHTHRGGNIISESRWQQGV